MRRKLHWLLISRLAIAAGLLALVSMTAGDNGGRSFVPMLTTVALATVVLSVISFAALRTRMPYFVQAYVQFSLDICIATWLIYSTGDVESPFLALYLVIWWARWPESCT